MNEKPVTTPPENNIVVTENTGKITVCFVLTPLESIRRGFYFTFGVVVALGVLVFLGRVIQWMNQ